LGNDEQVSFCSDNWVLGEGPLAAKAVSDAKVTSFVIEQGDWELGLCSFRAPAS